MSEIVADVAEEAAEAVAVVQNNPVLLVGVALVAASAGGFVGYKYAIKKLTPVFEERLAEELEASKEFLKTAEDAADDLFEKAKAEAMALGDSLVEGAEEFDNPIEEVQKIVRNYNRPVVKESTSVVEILMPDPADDEGGQPPVSDAPYLISFNDYHSQHDANWTQVALTYYANDETLADENDQVINEVEATIGVDNLAFIHKTRKETVFVRNPKTMMDFEVAWYARSYAETMSG